MSCDPLKKDAMVKQCTEEQKKIGSGKSLCEEVEEKSNDIFDIFDKTLDNFSVKGVIDSVGTWLSGKNDQEQKVRFNEAISIIQKNYSSAESACDNKFGINQSNIFKGCEDGSTVITGNIEQSNNLTAAQQCVSINLIKLISEQSSSIESMILQRTIQKAQGVGTENKIQQDICRNINSDMTACNFISSRQCCAQSLNVDQSNQINCGTVLKNGSIVQKNMANLLNICELSSNSDISTTQAMEDLFGNDQKGDQKAEGIDLTLILIVVVVVVAIVCFILLFLFLRSRKII